MRRKIEKLTEEQKECYNENISPEELEFIEKSRIEIDAMIKYLKR